MEKGGDLCYNDNRKGAKYMDCEYLKNKRILLVDDEQELLDMVVSILKEEGFCNIWTAKNVRDALSVAAAVEPEIAILDVVVD